MQKKEKSQNYNKDNNQNSSNQQITELEKQLEKLSMIQLNPEVLKI